MSKGEETRTAVLDEATQMASRVGLGGLTIGQLAEHTELSKSGLFAHFQSKESLQLQVLQHARERFIDLVVRPSLAAPRGVTRLRTLFDGWLQWTQGLQGGCIFVAASVELDDKPGLVRDALVRSERDWLEVIATVARSAMSEGEFRTDLDPDQFAFEVHGVMLAHHHASRLLQDPTAHDRAGTALESLILAAELASSRPTATHH